MSEFKCEVVRVKIEPHPNADAIEIARIGDYQSVARKGQVQDGDLAVYIPEQAVVPEWLLRKMGMYDDERKKGGLAGSAGNRVKAIRLRGVVSQGLILPTLPDPDGPLRYVDRIVDGESDCKLFAEGDDAAKFLGITKYEPKLPSYMSARVVGADLAATHKYDFDNLKKAPSLFDDGEGVAITEKIHGTLMMIGVVPESQANEKYYKGRVIISSKGMGAKGFILDHNDEGSVYAQAAQLHGLLDKALTLADMLKADKPMFVLGEVFGKTLGGSNIQDLTYTDEPLGFCAFDICVGNRGVEHYAPMWVMCDMCETVGIPMVPVLYEGPYSKDIVLEHTDGKTTLGGKHIREGVVVKSLYERRHPHFGRKIAKSVSDDYLLRKNATEFN